MAHVLPLVPLTLTTLLTLFARVALLGLVPALLSAQDAATGTVSGRVSARPDTGATASASSATVSLAGRSVGALTGPDGRFVLERVPAGPATVRVRLFGYRTVERAIRVRAGDTVHVEVVLQSEAYLLSAVRTDARAVDTETFTTKPNVGTIAMGAAAMAGVPSVGEPDVVRVVQLLPGVVARNDYSTGLNVRGGEADQNLILLDGHPIHNPFHLGGLFSTFMDATVGGIELMTGAFPSRYGGRLSSVLEVHSVDEAHSGVHATADVSALAATGRLSGAFGRGRGTWSVAGRRTYADALQSIFTDNIFPYHFRDLHARAAYQLPGQARLSVTAYHGKDVLDANLAEFATDSVMTKAGGGQWAYDWGNLVVGVTLSKELGPVSSPLIGWALGDSTTIEQRVSTSGFATRLDLGDGALTQRSELSDLRFSGSLLTRGASHDRSIGYEVATNRVRYASGSAQTGTTGFDLTQRPKTGALWIDDLWRLSPRWLVEGGLRAEGLSGRDWAALSPRLSVKYLASSNVALTAGAGRVTQWMQSLAGDGALRYFDIWIASDSFIPVAAAWHYVAGVERRLDAGSVRLEGFVKQYDRVLEANWSEDPGRRGDEFFEAKGLSYGLDVFARWQPATGANGWMTYSYGVSSRWRDSVRWAPGHDRRHELDVVATWPLARYRLGAHFGLATGTPYTPITGEIVRRVYDPSRDRWGTGDPRLRLEPLGGVRNSERFPPTHRLDLDASREFLYRGATVAPYLSIVNAYGAKNVFVYLYDYSTDRPKRRAISQFPVLPSLGVRIGF
ncbi:MAG: TonB-dependent receptor [Gemmatimonadaceae bacterium]